MSNEEEISGEALADATEANKCEHVNNGITYAAPNKCKCKLCGARFPSPSELTQ